MRTTNKQRPGARGWWSTLLLGGVLLLGGCSDHEGLAPDSGERVAVSFTAAADGAAVAGVKGTRSAGFVSEARAITGTTATGVPYADYVSAEGFETRVFYPGRTGTPEADSYAGLQTRTTNGGTEWEQNDAVGIFMLANGGTLTNSSERLADNKKYIATPGNPASGASFAPADATNIYYPQTGKVDFIAYYPYSNITNYTYTISVADQSNPAAIDMLYAKTTNVAKSHSAVDLQFKHMLSRITLNVKAGEGITATDIENLTAAAVTFKGMPVEVTMALQDGSIISGADLTQTFNPLKAATANSGYEATFSAIVVPQAANIYPSRTIVFAVGGQNYTWTIPEANAFASGKHHTYPITVQKNGITVGAPSIAAWTQNDNGTTTDPNTVLEMVKIPAGTFKMGSSDGSNVGGDPLTEVNTEPKDFKAYGDERPQHWVKLTEDFYLSKYPVTNAQYAAFLNAKGIGDNGRGDVTYDEDGATVSNEEQTFISDDIWGVKWNTNKWIAQSGYENHPVILVTWYGAKAYADWIGGFLPTEAQWEYACRAGTTTPYSYGDTENGGYMWYDNNSGGTHKVGNKKPNPWGLYDMHGNVWEWCLDQWDNSFNYPTAANISAAVENPINISGSRRVLRGGSWFSRARDCRSASRDNLNPDDADFNIGFRVAVVPQFTP